MAPQQLPQQLKTTTNSGTQTTTKTPQAAGPANSGAARSSQVQPGTAREALTTGAGGVPLRGGALTTIDLSAHQAETATTTTLTSPPGPPVPPQSPINPILLGGSGLVLLVAIVLFIGISRSAKNTTDY